MVCYTARKAVRSHLGTTCSMCALPLLSLVLWWQDLSHQFPGSFPVPPAFWLLCPPLAFPLADSAVGRFSSNATVEHRGWSDSGKTKGWHIAICHCKKLPCSECSGLERPRPEGLLSLCYVDLDVSGAQLEPIWASLWSHLLLTVLSAKTSL